MKWSIGVLLICMAFSCRRGRLIAGRGGSGSAGHCGKRRALRERLRAGGDRPVRAQTHAVTMLRPSLPRLTLAPCRSTPPSPADAQDATGVAAARRGRRARRAPLGRRQRPLDRAGHVLAAAPGSRCRTAWKASRAGRPALGPAADRAARPHRRAAAVEPLAPGLAGAARDWIRSTRRCWTRSRSYTCRAAGRARRRWRDRFKAFAHNGAAHDVRRRATSCA